MTADLFDSDAVHLAAVGDIPMRVGRKDGRWRIKVCDRGWRMLPDSIGCFSDIADSAELARVESWVAELIEVHVVRLHPNPRQRGTFVVEVTG